MRGPCSLRAAVPALLGLLLCVNMQAALGANDANNAAPGNSAQGGKPPHEDVLPHERYPYVASLRNPGPSKAHFCGGALVAPSVVLTAASCVDPAAGGIAAPDVHVPAPCLNCHLIPSENFRTAKTVGTYVHPEWTGDPSVGFDIALIHLDAELPGPFLAVPADALGPLGIESELVAGPSRLAALPGYFARRNDQSFKSLARGMIPLLDRQQCEALFEGRRRFPHPSFVCAGGPRSKVCLSDVGSPLILGTSDSPDGDLAIGVLSRATTGSCWHPVAVPALFASFSGFDDGLDLIKQGLLPAEPAKEPQPAQPLIAFATPTNPMPAAQPDLVPPTVTPTTKPPRNPAPAQETQPQPQDMLQQQGPQQAQALPPSDGSAETQSPKAPPPQQAQPFPPQWSMPQKEAFEAYSVDCFHNQDAIVSMELVGPGYCVGTGGFQVSHSVFSEASPEGCLRRCRGLEGDCAGVTYNPAAGLCFVAEEEVGGAQPSSSLEVCMAKGEADLEVAGLSACQPAAGPADSHEVKWSSIRSSADSCAVACLINPKCAAVSYDASLRECFQHNGAVSAEPLAGPACWRREATPCPGRTIARPPTKEPAPAEEEQEQLPEADQEQVQEEIEEQLPDEEEEQLSVPDQEMAMQEEDEGDEDIEEEEEEEESGNDDYFDYGGLA